MREHRFILLLCALALLISCAPLARAVGQGRHPILVGSVITILFVLMLLSAVFAVSRSRTTEVIALLLAIPTIVMRGIMLWRASDLIVVSAHTIGIVFIAYTVVLILKLLFVADRVTADMICASLCVYLLLGVLWSLGYSLLDLHDEQAFSYPLNENEDGTMQCVGAGTATSLYYSFVTMSTLGYGDIVPRSSLARMAAALQAIIGQLYLAVLVARLVGLHIVHATRGQSASGKGHGSHGGEGK